MSTSRRQLTVAIPPIPEYQPLSSSTSPSPLVLAPHPSRLSTRRNKSPTIRSFERKRVRPLPPVPRTVPAAPSKPSIKSPSRSRPLPSIPASSSPPSIRVSLSPSSSDSPYPSSST